MDEKCFFAYIFREKRGISKNRAATNSVEGCASKKEQSRERQRFLLSTRSEGVELTKTVRFSCQSKLNI